MQRELSNGMFGSSYTGPLRGGHDADVAHGEDEFDAPALGCESIVSVMAPQDGLLHGDQRMNPGGFGDPLAFPLMPSSRQNLYLSNTLICEKTPDRPLLSGVNIIDR